MNAQEQTEKRWLYILSGGESIPPHCGWCQFAVGISDGTRSICYDCPVVRVFGDRCENIKEYRDWEDSELIDEQELAQRVYELLIAHREQLIAAAKEIENEHNPRKDSAT